MALFISILFELFTSFSKYNCEEEFVHTNNIKICIVQEEEFANAFVNEQSLRNNDTIIFVTKKLYKKIKNKNISKEEFEAILEHELNHLRKKHYIFIPLINFLIPFIFVLFILEVFVVILKSIFTGKYSIIEFLMLLILFALNHLVNYSINIFVKKLEFEADNVKDKKHLTEALLKLSRINNTPLYAEGKTHPSVERRIQRLLEER
jgi:Zn-dependent protease with chaperone function